MVQGIELPVVAADIDRTIVDGRGAGRALQRSVHGYVPQFRTVF